MPPLSSPISSLFRYEALTCLAPCPCCLASRLVVHTMPGARLNSMRRYREGAVVISDEGFASCAAVLSNQLELYRKDMVAAAWRSHANAAAIENARSAYLARTCAAWSSLEVWKRNRKSLTQVVSHRGETWQCRRVQLASIAAALRRKTEVTETSSSSLALVSVKRFFLHPAEQTEPRVGRVYGVYSTFQWLQYERPRAATAWPACCALTELMVTISHSVPWSVGMKIYSCSSSFCGRSMCSP